MTDKNAGLLPVSEKKFNYELKYDRNECGSAGCTSYGLITDYHSPADILIRWPMHGFSRHVENAAEKAEELAKEVVKRWNAYAAPPPKAVTEDARGALEKLDIDELSEMLSDACSNGEGEHRPTARYLFEALQEGGFLQSPSKAVDVEVVEALEFYADSSNYDGTMYKASVVENDQGCRAREALAQAPRVEEVTADQLIRVIDGAWDRHGNCSRQVLEERILERWPNGLKIKIKE